MHKDAIFLILIIEQTYNPPYWLKKTTINKLTIPPFTSAWKKRSKVFDAARRWRDKCKEPHLSISETENHADYIVVRQVHEDPIS